MREPKKGVVMKETELEMWFNKGILLHNQGKLDEALHAFDQALKIDSKIVNLWSNKGLIFMNMNRYNNALLCFNEALTIDPYDEPSLGSKGVALTKLGRLEEAINVYDKALEINPRSLVTLFNKGLDLITLKNPVEALKTFEIYLKIADDDEVWFHKAYAYTELGEYNKAIKIYDKLIKKDPSNFSVLNNKGSALLKMERNEEALKTFNEAIKVNSKDHLSWFNKAIALEKLEMRLDASNAYGYAYYLDQDNQKYKETYFRIKKSHMKLMRKVMEDCAKKGTPMSTELFQDILQRGFKPDPIYKTDIDLLMFTKNVSSKVIQELDEENKKGKNTEKKNNEDEKDIIFGLLREYISTKYGPFTVKYSLIYTGMKDNKLSIQIAKLMNHPLSEKQIKKGSKDHIISFENEKMVKVLASRFEEFMYYNNASIEEQISNFCMLINLRDKSVIEMIHETVSKGAQKLGKLRKRMDENNFKRMTDRIYMDFMKQLTDTDRLNDQEVKLERKEDLFCIHELKREERLLIILNLYSKPKYLSLLELQYYYELLCGGETKTDDVVISLLGLERRGEVEKKFLENKKEFQYRVIKRRFSTKELKNFRKLVWMEEPRQSMIFPGINKYFDALENLFSWMEEPKESLLFPRVARNRTYSYEDTDIYCMGCEEPIPYILSERGLFNEITLLFTRGCKCVGKKKDKKIMYYISTFTKNARLELDECRERKEPETCTLEGYWCFKHTNYYCGFCKYPLPKTVVKKKWKSGEKTTEKYHYTHCKCKKRIEDFGIIRKRVDPFKSSKNRFPNVNKKNIYEALPGLIMTIVLTVLSGIIMNLGFDLYDEFTVGYFDGNRDIKSFLLSLTGPSIAIIGFLGFSIFMLLSLFVTILLCYLMILGSYQTIKKKLL